MTPSQQTGNFGPSLNQRTLPSIARNDQLARIIMQAMRTCLVGIVQKFDPGPPATVDVLIATNEYATIGTIAEKGFTDEAGNFVANPSAGQLILRTKSLPLPLLTKIPIQIPTAGGYSLTLPIQVGDECLVVFLDTDPSVWFQNGGAGNNPTSTEQRHGLSNPIAIFGLRSTPRAIQNYSTDSVQLRSDDGNTVIDLKNGQVTITGTTVNVNCTDATIQASDKVQIDGANQVNLDAGSGTVNIGGGNIVIGPSTEIDGHPFLLHTHSGVSTGGGTSGPVT